ncbi:MAG: ATP-binding protein [Proteobacteria bacterium]|nr:ATP-binding protein [Pseudomonadota bacterium]NDC25182.1 ATP-binding protein [Pseudomonadota bacterium]NDD05081.1 ATP-binding protein [Pseudomonadota bacterium]NDG27651.1 ATP-binding protein [Pseudomonadota bacterium]
MSTYNRPLAQKLKKRLQDSRCYIQVLVGPRQVGKTTALKAALQGKGVYETADSPTPLTAEILNQWWDRALQNPEKILAVDEIQKIAGWSEVIKRRWDEAPYSLKVVLTGSSALLLEKALGESLAGRFELIRATHWNFSEAHEAFGMTLQQFIEFGCYPGSLSLLPEIDRWGDYIRDSIVESVLGRDLLMLHPVSNPALLRQVFSLALGMPAHVLSLQKMVGQLQSKISLPTLQSYLSLLGQAFLVSGISKYSANLFREKKSSPKLIVHDNALLRAFVRPIESTLSGEVMGYYFENAIGARFVEAGWDTFYWKSGDKEVDYVVHGPQGEKYAIEVKSTLCSSKDLNGLKTFCQTHSEYQPCLISLVNQTVPGTKSISPEWALSL